MTAVVKPDQSWRGRGLLNEVRYCLKLLHLSAHQTSTWSSRTILTFFSLSKFKTFRYSDLFTCVVFTSFWLKLAKIVSGCQRYKASWMKSRYHPWAVTTRIGCLKSNQQFASIIFAWKIPLHTFFACPGIRGNVVTFFIQGNSSFPHNKLFCQPILDRKLSIQKLTNLNSYHLINEIITQHWCSL